MEEVWCGAEARLIIRCLERHDHHDDTIAAARREPGRADRGCRRRPDDPIVRSPCESSNHCRPGFRLAIHPADCAPLARAVGLLARFFRSTRRWREIERRHPVGIVLSGGPKSVSEAGAPHCEPAVYTAGVPVLGICYGMQLMTHALGGEVAPAPHREFGLATIDVQPDAPLFASCRRAGVWASHGDFVKTAPPGFRSPRRARTLRSRPWRPRAPPVRAAVPSRGRAHRSRLDILRNFAYDVCGCTGDWTMSSFVQEATDRIREQVGDGRVVCGLSGGVDSTVAADADPQAIGDRLTCIFVDNGVMRQDEAGQIRTRFERLSCRSSSPMPRPVPGPAGRHHRPGAEAEDHRRRVHRRLRDRSAEARLVRFPRPGHALSRRDRERVGDRPVARDQEPPQRRRAARAHALQARRTAATASNT